MRELRGDDLFTVLSIIGKLDVKDELVNMFNGESTPTTDHKKTKAAVQEVAEKRGMAIMAGIMQKALLNIGKIKTDVNTLLADLCGVKVKEIQDLSLIDYTALLVKFFKKPELKSFFGSISSLLV